MEQQLCQQPCCWQHEQGFQSFVTGGTALITVDYKTHQQQQRLESFNKCLPVLSHTCSLLHGVGGVHRGGENSMDVSADLVELV